MRNERVDKIMQLVDVSSCSAAEIKHVRDLVSDFAGVFALEGEPLPATHLLKHTIEVTTDKPIRAKPFKYAHALKNQVRCEVDKLIEQDIVEPSVSPHHSNLWIVPKKPGPDQEPRWRLVNDFRLLNDVTLNTCMPLAHQSDVLDRLSTANYITVMDLKQGFHQILMDPESAPLTAFSAPLGTGYQQFQYKRMAMGLKEATNTFTRAMILALAGLQGNEVEIYLDDLMIPAENVDEHGVRTRRVLKRLMEANMVVEPSKCQFLKREALVLGHIVGRGQIKTDPKKIEAVKRYPRPTTTKKLKQALGFFNYYRRFVKDYSKIARPLSKLLRKGAKFVWEEEQETAFETLKAILCSEPVLSAPDYSQEFYICTDASDYAISGVLSQGPLGEDRPIAYASRCLKGNELKWPTFHKELLAMKYAAYQFYPYIFNHEVTFVTDHQPLCYAMTSNNPDLRFNKLRADLHGFNFKIMYRPGSQNHADALSRNPVIEEGQINPECPRADLLQLAEQLQHEADPDGLDNIPAKVLALRAVRKKGIDRSKKVKQVTSDSDSDGPEPKRGKNQHKDGNSHLLYKKGAYLAIRNEFDDFWLCRANQDVMSDSEEVRITWFSERPYNEQIYFLDYNGTVVKENIITTVTMRKSNRNYYLKKAEIQRIREILQESLATSKSRPRKQKSFAENGKLQKKAQAEPTTANAQENEDENENMEEGIPTASAPASPIPLTKTKKSLKPQSIAREKPNFVVTPERDDNSLEEITVPIQGPRIISDLRLKGPLNLVVLPHAQQQQQELNLENQNEQSFVNLDSNISAQQVPATADAAADKECGQGQADSAEQTHPSFAQQLFPPPDNEILANCVARLRENRDDGKLNLRLELNNIEINWRGLGEENTTPSQSDHHRSLSPQYHPHPSPSTNINCGSRQQYYHLAPQDDMDVSTISSAIRDSAPVAPNILDQESSDRQLALQLQEIDDFCAIPSAGINSSHQLGPLEDFEGIPRGTDRNDNLSRHDSIISSNAGRFAIGEASDYCAEPSTHFIRFTAIPHEPRGNCLFHSLIKLMNFSMGPLDLRRILLNSPHLQHCGEPAEAAVILSSDTSFGDIDCIYVFSRHFDQNICIHDTAQREGTQFWLVKANNSDHFIHLHFEGAPHFTPLLPEIGVQNSVQNHTQDQPRGPDEDHSPQEPPNNSESRRRSHTQSSNHPLDEEHESSSDSDADLAPNLHSAALERCLVARARPPREKPPWAPIEGEVCPPFAKLYIVNDHPFRYAENLAYPLSADNFLRTDILDAMIERSYINKNELASREHNIGEIHSSTCRDLHLFGFYIKNFVDDKVLKANITRCVKALRAKVIETNITSLGIVRDLAVLSVKEWATFVEVFENIFAGLPIAAVFFQNNLSVPKVADRMQVLKMYHESAVGGHRGINGTYRRIARHFYWRNMRPEVKQFVLCCRICQEKKVSRIKTRLPMVISDTPSRAFEKISMDFYGPIKVTPRGNRYVLTIQDWLTKFLILTPVQRATATEVARVLVDRVFSWTGPVKTIVTDQGTHFQNNLLEEFAKIFRIEKYYSTRYHPQSNGSIERAHSTITNYLRSYVEQNDEWDLWLSLCQHTFNDSENEATGISPHLLVFGYESTMPSTFPPNEELATYSDYLVDITEKLTQLQTSAALNLIQAKYRSKYYYDRKLNTKHFRQGEMVYLLKEPQKNKFDVQYQGPYEIAAINYNNHNVELVHKGKVIITHIDKIKRACMIKLGITEINELEEDERSITNQGSDSSDIQDSDSE